MLNTIDLAVLHPLATYGELVTACDIVQAYNMASVCVRPDMVGEALKLTQRPVGTVVGFPHGYNLTSIKFDETLRALDQGATEIDMVINQGWFVDGEDDKVEGEIAQIAALCRERKAILKVIIETCNLNNLAVCQACQIAERAGAHFVKSSTGFGSSGACPTTIKLMLQSVSSKVGVKASGGITVKSGQEFLDMGCNRLGVGFSKIEPFLELQCETQN